MSHIHYAVSSIEADQSVLILADLSNLESELVI